ncbi:MAG TPA: hemerythrin domain-containing protein [Thermoanaerobaculia bacterium]|jgi:hemerythrin-like domain-containing protein
MNAIDLLLSDHTRLRELMPRLYDQTIAADERNRLRETVEKEIKIHSLIEEEIFYPAWKDATNAADDRDYYYESIEEHHVADMLLPELMTLDASADSFRAKAKVLFELFDHHAGEEEEHMFPRAKQLFGEARLAELGIQMVARRDDLDQKWSGRVGKVLQKAQTVADKFAPSSVKEARVEANRDK